MVTDELPMLRDLLRAPDVASITQGVELAVVLGPEVVDALLDRVDFEYTPRDLALAGGEAQARQPKCSTEARWRSRPSTNGPWWRTPG